MKETKKKPTCKQCYHYDLEEFNQSGICRFDNPRTGDKPKEKAEWKVVDAAKDRCGSFKLDRE